MAGTGCAPLSADLRFCDSFVPTTRDYARGRLIVPCPASLCYIMAAQF
jgi:hypothetical protein